MIISRQRLAGALVCLNFLLACPMALGQTNQPADRQPQHAKEKTEARPAARPSTQLPIFVSDASGNFVEGLRAEDFRVTEDGQPQSVTFFEKQELPARYALLIDSSGSLRSLFDAVLRTGGALLGGTRPGDEAMVIRFVGGDNIQIVQDFTADKAELSGALDEMYVEGGLTALIDGLYLGARKVSETSGAGEPRRRALVVITDGDERGSRHKFDELLDYLRRQSVQVYAVGMTDAVSPDAFRGGGGREKARKLLSTLAQETGGRAFFPKTVSELNEAVKGITAGLRAQYVLGYEPTNKAADGKVRRIEVKLTGAAAQGKRQVYAPAGHLSAAAASKGGAVQ